MPPAGRKKTKRITPNAKLRGRAEAQHSQDYDEKGPPLLENDSQRLLYELQVHQIQLEMQNEELRLANRQVELGLERYTDLYDFAPTGYFTLDPAGIIRQVNLSGARLLGQERANLVGRPFKLFLIETEWNNFTAILANGFKSHAPQTGLTALQRKDNPSVWLHLTLSVSQDGGECLLSATDITQQKLAEEQIRSLNAELEQHVQSRTALLTAANQELEAFAYSVSHDLRAPLRAMNGFSSALLSDYSDNLDELGRHYIKRIQEATLRMDNLINDLLNLSRVTRTEFLPQKVDLSSLAREVVTDLRAADPQRPVECSITDHLTVTGDANLLKLALENLLNNAFKFSSHSDHPAIAFGVKNLAEEKVFFVSDNGIGFEMQYAQKLFAPFQRLHANKEYPGTGIGLTIVHRIITRHGGRIWPESEPGRGTTFYFTLMDNPLS